MGTGEVRVTTRREEVGDVERYFPFFLPKKVKQKREGKEKGKKR